MLVGLLVILMVGLFDVCLFALGWGLLLVGLLLVGFLLVVCLLNGLICLVLFLWYYKCLVVCLVGLGLIVLLVGCGCVGWLVVIDYI